MEVTWPTSRQKCIRFLSGGHLPLCKHKALRCEDTSWQADLQFPLRQQSAAVRAPSPEPALSCSAAQRQSWQCWEHPKATQHPALLAAITSSPLTGLLVGQEVVVGWAAPQTELNTPLRNSAQLHLVPAVQAEGRSCECLQFPQDIEGRSGSADKSRGLPQPPSQMSWAVTLQRG